MIFLLPVFLVWGATEYFYRTVESNYSYKHHELIESYKDIQTLILGDSHAFFGINPNYLDSRSFNLSNISQSLYFDQLLFEKHRDSLPNLKNVILTIGYYSLSQLENTKEDTWRKYFYQHQMDIEVPVISSLDCRRYSLSLARRFDKSVELIKQYIADGTIIGCDDSGWGTYYKEHSGADLDSQSKIVAKRHEDFLLDFEKNIERLQSVIRYCQQRDCHVYLIDMPVYKGYLSLLNADKLEKITKTCSALEKDNTNVTYINLRQDARLDTTDLYDPDHLNHHGARKYTKIIQKIISDLKNKD